MESTLSYQRCSADKENVRCGATQSLLLLPSHVGHQVAHTVAVAKLIVIPVGEGGEQKVAQRGGSKYLKVTGWSKPYHVTSLTKCSLRAIPAPASKMEERLSPLKSVDTT